MTDTTDIVRAHYSATGLTGRIREALLRIAPDDRRLTVADLESMDHFHTRGLLATRDLAAMTAIGPGSGVLDLGCGLGGPARFLAATFGCHVIGVDLSDSFIEAARYLTEPAWRSGSPAGSATLWISPSSPDRSISSCCGTWR